MVEPQKAMQEQVTGRDINSRAIQVTAGLIILIIILAGVIAWQMSSHLRRPAARVGNYVGTPAPAPALQPNPTADLSAYRAGKIHLLTTYGWVNRQTGVAHIPIERAITIVAQGKGGPP